VASDRTQANGESYSTAISADGRFVAFDSYAANLVTGDTNGVQDIFVHDRLTGVTTRESVGPGGVQAADLSSFSPSISADGRFVAFASQATNLAPNTTRLISQVYVRDRLLGVTILVSAANGTPGDDSSALPSISANGRVVAFESEASNLVPGDANRTRDVFRRDLASGAITQDSVKSDGTQASAFRPGAAKWPGRQVTDP
jgi:Tol biopolymer transport system component